MDNEFRTCDHIRDKGLGQKRPYLINTKTLFLSLLLLSFSTHVEFEEDHISVLHLVVSSLLLQLTGSLNGSLGLQLLKVLEFVDLGADESLLEVGVDHTGSLGSERSLSDGPALDLIGSRGEEVNQIQHMVSGGDDTRQLALRVVLLAIRLGLLLGHVEQLGLEASAEGNHLLAEAHGSDLLADLVHPTMHPATLPYSGSLRRM